VYPAQIVTRHGIGSTLTCQTGPCFHVLVFNETCKAMGFNKIHASSYTPQSNDIIVRWHRTLHTTLCHQVNASHTDCDLQVRFFLMAYRVTPNKTTGYSPFFLQHGREMSRPVNNIKPKVSTNARDLDQRIESLKTSLRSAYRSVKREDKMSHQ
jgi:hypothetical protein